MKSYTIPVIAGDGIGPEVIAEGRKVLSAAADKYGFTIHWKEYPHGAEYYLRTGELISDESLADLGRYRTIYFGAVGDERVSRGILEKGIILALRYHFDQYVNLRPVRIFPGVSAPIQTRPGSAVDLVIVRENTEDFYIDAGGLAGRGVTSAELKVPRSLYDCRFRVQVETSSERIAYQFGLASSEGVRRILRYAFKLARSRRKCLALCDKANVLTSIYGLWRAEFEELAREFPEVKTQCFYVDAIAALLLLTPGEFDVIVAPNLFGDILSDLAAAIAGSMGLAPGANLNPEGTSLFEPIHGSAPALRGQKRANPIAAIWAGAMMLESLGEAVAGHSVLVAIERCLRERRVRTPDLGGTSHTQEVGDEICRLLS
jgi:tartrate dehydrogenase/decarboxylase/D-malate dehydrogenase